MRTPFTGAKRCDRGKLCRLGEKKKSAGTTRAHQLLLLLRSLSLFFLLLLLVNVLMCSAKDWSRYIAWPHDLRLGEESRSFVQDGWNHDGKGGFIGASTLKLTYVIVLTCYSEGSKLPDGLLNRRMWDHAHHRHRYGIQHLLPQKNNRSSWIQPIDGVAFLRGHRTHGRDDATRGSQLYDPDAAHLPPIPASDVLLGQTSQHGIQQHQDMYKDKWEDRHRIGAISGDLTQEYNVVPKCFLKVIEALSPATDEPHLYLKQLPQSLELPATNILKQNSTFSQLDITFDLTFQSYFEACGHMFCYTVSQSKLKPRERTHINTRLVCIPVQDEHVRAGMGIISEATDDLTGNPAKAVKSRVKTKLEDGFR